MVSSAGLSAAYGGYQQARKTDTEIEHNDIANETARTAQEGDKAWGNTIPVLQQMLQPGATQMPAGPQMAGGPPPGGMPQQAGPTPQAPPPGQSSQPMEQGPQQGGAPPLGQPPAAAAGPQPQMLGGPSPPSPQASPQGAPPQQAPQGPGGGQPSGRLDLHTVMAAVVKANPGVKPNVIAAAVAKALPLMTAQSQMDYKNLMVQLSAGRLNETQAHHAETEANAATRTGNQTADTTSKIERRGAQTDQGGQRLDIQRGREGRLAAQAEIRNDQRYLQLEQQSKALETRIQQGGDRAALSEWRAIVDAQHKRALEIIQSGKNAIGVMDPEERKALVKEQNEFYRSQIEGMRKGPGKPERPAGADTTGLTPPRKLDDRPPPSGPGVAAPQRTQFKNQKTGALEDFDLINGQWVPVAAQAKP